MNYNITFKQQYEISYESFLNHILGEGQQFLLKSLSDPEYALNEDLKRVKFQYGDAKYFKPYEINEELFQFIGENGYFIEFDEELVPWEMGHDWAGTDRNIDSGNKFEENSEDWHAWRDGWQAYG